MGAAGHRQQVEKNIVSHTANLFNLKVDLLLYDTTTASFSIDYEDEDFDEPSAGLRKFGKSKENTWAPQVVVALTVTRECLPVRCWVFHGDTNLQIPNPSYIGMNKMKKNILRFSIWILSLAITLNFGFAADKKPDYWPTKGWRTASPESQGMDSFLLVEMLDMIWEKSLELENLLTMTSGFECSDPFLYLQIGMMNMILDANLRMSADWTQFIIDLPMAEAPGTRYKYCNGNPFLLSVIIQKQTGMNALAFADKHLFVPLGISDVGWGSNPDGITLGYGELFMRAQDMAKIGFLYLNNGLWDGKRIISSRWINVSTRKHIETSLLPGYGYHWWIASPGIYTAAGNKGQFIMVAPEKNLVAVFTGRLSPNEFLIPLDFMKSFILAACIIINDGMADG